MQGNEPGPEASPAATAATGQASGAKTTVNGGRFDFDDGGTYCGGWDDGKAHGHGVCTGPKGQGAYAGSWHYGFEVSGIYTWPSGSAFEGQWQNGKRHGLGVETRGRWLYRGEWTQGFKGRYGVRQSATSNARYEGTWANGLQDGYGSETYADGGTFQGQWLRGMRHGYGVRASAPFGMASHYRPNKSVRASMTSLRSTEAGAPGAATPDPAAERDKRVDDSRGGFVLKARSDDAPPKARRGSLVEKSSGIKKSILSGLKIRKQRSTGDLEKRGTSASMRSTGSTASWISNESSQSVMTNVSVHTDSNASFLVEEGEQMDPAVVETYFGEWKNDKRAGFGISERSDGLKYEGEWFANKKYGYGVTTFKDGAKEEGKYKNNVLITSQKKKHLFLIRSAKFRERIDAAVSAANRASKIALQKADIAISRTATARGKGESADMAADHAREDSDVARSTAKQFAPDFHQPGLERPRGRDMPKYRPPPEDALPGKSILHQSGPPKIPANETPTQSQQNQHQPSQNQNQNQPSQSQNQFQPSQNQNQYQSSQNQNQYQSNQNQYPSNQNQFQSNQSQNQYQPNQNQYPANQNQYQPNASQYSNAAGPSMSKQGPPSEPGYPNRTGSTDQLAHNRVTPPPGDEVQRLPGSTLRRDSRVKALESPAYGYQQSLNDRFDQYKRPPSRDGSVDRFSRGGRPGPGSRQSSVDKTLPGFGAPAPAREPSVDRTIRAGSNMRAPTPMRGTTPAPSLAQGNGSVVGAASPNDEFAMRRRNPAQEVAPPIGGQPKRTESLYITPGKPPAQKSLPAAVPLQRKKSLPDVQGLPKATDPMSREEVSVLSSARREEVRRMADEHERLRANPLLYLVSPHVKDWFSRQQLVLLVLFINISLAIMFFKLLT